MVLGDSFLEGWGVADEARLSDLLERAAGKLRVLYGAEVTGVEATAGGSVEVAYRRDSKERLVSANAVLVSVPAPDAARIAAPVLSGAERESLARIRYTPSVTVALAMRRSWTHHPQLIRVPHAEGSPLETALLEPGLIAGDLPKMLPRVLKSLRDRALSARREPN